MTDLEHELLTTKEVAAILRVSKRTVEAMRLRPDGPPFAKYGPGRSSPITYRRSQLMAWIAAREDASSPEPATLNLYDLMARLRGVTGVVDAGAWCPITPHQVSLVVLVDVAGGYADGAVEREARAWHPRSVSPSMRMWVTESAESFEAVLREGSRCTVVRLASGGSHGAS